MSGRAILPSFAISPGWLVPISSTALSVRSSAWKIVTGTPTLLLKLPCAFTSRRSRPSTWAIISLVVVLPFEPTTPTSRSTMAATAPFSNAGARKSWASKFAPRRAKKRSPARIERVSVETPVTASEARGRLGRPLTARATWLSCIIPRLLGFGLPADLAVVVVDVRQRDVEILGSDLLDGFEDPQRQVRREVEPAVDMRAAHHVFLPLSGRTPPSPENHPPAPPGRPSSPGTAPELLLRQFPEDL